MQPVEHKFAIGDRVRPTVDRPHLSSAWTGKIVDIMPSQKSFGVYLCEFYQGEVFWQALWLIDQYLEKIQDSEQEPAPTTPDRKKPSRKKLNVKGGQP